MRPRSSDLALRFSTIQLSALTRLMIAAAPIAVLWAIVLLTID